jgi:hypothetical protein
MPLGKAIQQLFRSVFAKVFRAGIGGSAGPADPLGHYSAECNRRQQDEAEVGFRFHLVEVVEGTVAFGIDGLLWHQSPKQYPGSAFIGRIVVNSVGIMYRNNFGGHAAGREQQQTGNEQQRRCVHEQLILATNKMANIKGTGNTTFVVVVSRYLYVYCRHEKACTG